jgi:hypothetical protein
MKRIATLLGVSLMMTALPIASAVAQQPATPTAPQAILVGSDSLVGGTVRDNEGRDIGKVSRLLIDPNDGRVTSIVIATGGTLGVGANTISVPWSSVKDWAGPGQGDRDARARRSRAPRLAQARRPTNSASSNPSRRHSFLFLRRRSALLPDRRRSRSLFSRAKFAIVLDVEGCAGCRRSPTRRARSGRPGRRHRTCRRSRSDPAGSREPWPAAPRSRPGRGRTARVA